MRPSRFKTAAIVSVYAALASSVPPALSGCAPKRPQPAQVTAPQPPKREPFVVAIVVDQLPAWVADARFTLLPEDGGFARLRREGTWVKHLRYPYAATDTAPGHASLHTGKVPAESGVFGNEVPDASGKRVSVLRDASTRAVLPEGPSPMTLGSSAARLRVDNVADRLRAARPDALVVSISLKDRGAIMPGGHRPTHAVWFDAALDSFVTSTAFAEKYPAWAIGIGDHASVVRARSEPWTLGDRAWVEAHATTPDGQAGEGDLEGLGTSFPHVAKSANAFRASPASDKAIIDLALAAVATERDPARPSMLLLSLSSSDVLGHTFGPDSWEAWDHLYKLDRELARLFRGLDERVGEYAVLLSSDHGSVSMPEVDVSRAPWCTGTPDLYVRPCKPGARIAPNALRDELRVAVKAALGDGSYVQGVADPYVFLSEAGRALAPEARAKLDDVVRRTTSRNPGVSEVIDARVLRAECLRVLASARRIPERANAGEDVRVLVCRSWSEAAGDYYVLTHPGSFFDGEIVVGKGTSHGTPYLFDRTVPMLVRAPHAGIGAATVIDDPVDFAAFAAIEAALLGLDPRSPRDILGVHQARPERRAP